MPYRLSKRIGGERITLEVRNSGANGGTIFRTSSDYQHFLTVLARLARESNTIDVISYILLRDRFGLVVREHERGVTSAFMHRLSVSYAMYFHNKYNVNGKVFTGPYTDVLLSSDDDVVVAVCKQHLESTEINQDPQLYQWSSYHKYLYGQAPWLYKKPLLDYFGASPFASSLIAFTKSIGA